jgi:two-component system LytT family sensor kinase
MTSAAADAPSPMAEPRATRSVGAWWLAGFAVWSLLALLGALQNAVYFQTIGRPVPWMPLVGSRLLDWYTCALFTPVYFWLVYRFPLDRQHAGRRIPLYLGITALFVVLKYAIYVPLVRLLLPRFPGARSGFVEVLAGNFIIETIVFWCLIGIVHAVVLYQRDSEREAHAAELESRLTAARLEALTGQLNPHFMFNTLQAISTLVHRDAEAADRMLSRLGDLLRRTLQRGSQHEVPLSEELDLLDDYVDIMRVRLGDRVTFTCEVEESCEGALVPHFILQPLVENAVQHGVARRAGAGHIAVRGWRSGPDLVLTVRDDGPGSASPADDVLASGVGLTNTRLRLQALYQSQQRVALESPAEGGTEVRVELPYHLAPLRGPS